MPIGITNTTNITLENITGIINITEPMEFFINVNHTIYQGWLYFILLWALWAVLFLAAQGFKKQLLVNVMYSGAIISIVSFIFRAINLTQDGIVRGLLTDYQMWIFPILTAIVATTVWAIKDI